ncbi:MAG: alpha-L-fucosidase [Bacteroidales bacterium]|nr:alpha-L-fucosidase [Bacteroidales bacterium]
MKNESIVSMIAVIPLLLSLSLTLTMPPDGDIWNLPHLKPETGLYTEQWDTLSRYYNVPEWWRDAKFGAWSHWDPQSAAEDGDWYARGMYMPRSEQYRYHLEHYGHPSEYGYKDLCHDWVIDLWDPDDLMLLYIRMGAKYFLAMGNHHDNFDCWDSAYQPWNSVNVGPNQDIVGIWKETADKYGMPFGIGFHATPARTWGQFMPVRYSSDRTGPYAGVPYDALQTKEDGIGKWWEGLDPKDLYGPEHHDGRNSLETPFADQFMWRVDDAIRKYQPDMIYFDEHAGDSQVDLGINMGLGRFTPQILVDFYNIALKRESGNRQVVATFKGVGGRYDSFQNTPELLPLVDRSLVKSTEFFTEDEIMAFPFQTEVSLQEWHYKAGAPYCPATEIVTRLMQNVSRNGSLLLNITQRGRGNIDDEARQICEDIGRWLEINGEAVYGSRPFDVWGDERVIYTRNGGCIYAVLPEWDGGEIVLEALASGAPSVGRVKSVKVLGDKNMRVKFRQTPEGLIIKSLKVLKPVDGIKDGLLASGFKVLRIVHDKGWFNDDDPGVSTIGWDRKCNLGTGDFNNDLFLTDNAGDVWLVPFSGKSVKLIAPRGPEFGSMRVVIDGKDCGIVRLDESSRIPQQEVFKSSRLRGKEHVIEIISLEGLAAIDAMVVK